GSPATLAIRAPELLMLPSSTDGKKLETVVYRPDTATPVPVFINFSPYWGDTALTEGDAFSTYLVHEYVPRGYAVALSSVRGTGHSEGCFQVGGDLELKDARDVVDALAKMPWSSGSVGAGGKSYDSTTQNGMVAKFPHPALKTLFHVSGITDMYRYNGKDGVTYQNGLSFTPSYAAGQGIDEYGTPAGSGASGPTDESPQSLARLVDDLACPELARHVQSGEGTAADGVKDAYWQERDWVQAMPGSAWTGSVLFVHGLQDWNVKPDNVDPWLQALAAHGNPVKGWLHQWQQAGTGHVYPMRTDWNATMLRWLDHYLKGVDNGIDRELGFDVQGSDLQWRHAAAWPPAGERRVFALTGDPAEVLKASAAVRVTGTPWLRVAATSFSADPILYARLLDVAPDGSAVQVNEAARRGLLADDLQQRNLWAPGSTQTFNLTFYPMDLVLAPGHALVLRTGTPPPTATTPAAAAGPDGNAGFVISAAQAQVAYGAQELGLTLSDPAPLPTQPTPMKCFTC
ncbi:MAG TPA: CocE/NonD family hydrolase, partial [Candidatus Thermoplasmatota archaeon]|nr:CocE/NonD family hydrolase [Candidatus Thermoplasmatota archaeon]